MIPHMILIWILAGPFWVILYLAGFRDPEGWEGSDIHVMPSRDRSRKLSLDYVAFLLGFSSFMSVLIGLPILAIVALPIGIWFAPKGGFKDGVIVWGAYFIAAGFFSLDNAENTQSHPWWQRPVYLRPRIAGVIIVIGVVAILIAINYLPVENI